MQEATGGRVERGNIFFACLYVSQESKRWVHCAAMIQHAQACEHMSRCCTQQHAAARGCRADPSLPIITLAHLYCRKRNSCWGWSLLPEKHACGCTQSSESGCRIITIRLSPEKEVNTQIMHMCTQIMHMCILNTCCKRIARNKRSARTLCAATDFFRLSVCITGTHKTGARCHHDPKCAGV